MSPQPVGSAESLAAQITLVELALGVRVLMRAQLRCLRKCLVALPTPSKLNNKQNCPVKNYRTCVSINQGYIKYRYITVTTEVCSFCKAMKHVAIIRRTQRYRRPPGSALPPMVSLEPPRKGASIDTSYNLIRDP